MSMLNIPISLVTTANKNAEADSPIVWDGCDLVVTNESLCNLAKIRSDLNVLISKQLGYSSDMKLINKTISETNVALLQADSFRQRYALNVEKIMKSFYGMHLKVDGFLQDFETLLQRFEKNKEIVIEAETLHNLILSGSIFSLDPNSEKLEITKTRLGEFALIDTDIESISIAPGENVAIEYSIEESAYKISLETPKTADIVRSGNMITVESRGKTTHFEVKDAVIREGFGIKKVLPPSGYLYNLSVSDEFLAGDVVSGVEVERVGSTFKVGLTQAVLDEAQTTFDFGSGLKFVNGSVVLDYNYQMYLESGKNSSVMSTDEKYSISFDQSKIVRNTTDVYTNDQKVEVVETRSGNALTNLKIDLPSGAFSSNGATLLEDTEDFADEVDSRLLKSSEWGDTSLSLRKALGCPIMNLARFIMGYDPRAIENSSERALDIYSVLGPGLHYISLDVDLLPYMSMVGATSGGNLNFEQEIDLFLILERHLSYLTGDQNFSIQNSERGTKFKLLTVGEEQFSLRTTSELPAPSYTSSINLQNLVLDSDFLSSCGTVPTMQATTFVGPLAISMADVDYVLGNGRNNQKNISPLTVTNSNLKLKSSTQTKNSGSTTYTITVTDNNTSTDYVSKIERLEKFNWDANLDTVQEIEGHSNPDNVRLFARLFVAWRYNDVDLNKIVNFLGQNNSCASEYIAKNFTDNILNHNIGSDITQDHLRGNYEEFPILLSLNRTNLNSGKLKFTFTSNAEIGFFVAKANELVKYFFLPVTFVVDANYDMDFDSTRIFENCCM